MTVVALPSAPAVQGVDCSSTFQTTDLAAVERVFDPHVNLVIWKRRLSLPTAEYARWPGTPRLVRSIRAAQIDVTTVAREIGIAPQTALAADIVMLCDVFATLTGADRLGLRMDTTDRATCPKFHADRVMLRLITTYRGPATEWLEGETVRRAHAHDVLFTKGELWPDLACGPCVHRSPQPRAGQTRLMLTLDSL